LWKTPDGFCNAPPAREFGRLYRISPHFDLVIWWQRETLIQKLHYRASAPPVYEPHLKIDCIVFNERETAYSRNIVPETVHSYQLYSVSVATKFKNAITTDLVIATRIGIEKYVRPHAMHASVTLTFTIL
jgi:hypothetical protein